MTAIDLDKVSREIAQHTHRDAFSPEHSVEVARALSALSSGIGRHQYLDWRGEVQLMLREDYLVRKAETLRPFHAGGPSTKPTPASKPKRRTAPDVWLLFGLALICAYTSGLTAATGHIVLGVWLGAVAVGSLWWAVRLDRGEGS